MRGLGNLSAANLARQKVYRFRFLLPERGGEFIETVVAAIDEARRHSSDPAMQISHHRVLPSDPHLAAQVLGKVTPEEVGGIVLICPLKPQVRDARRRLEERGVLVIHLATGEPDQAPYSYNGIDNAAAGRTAARLMGRFIGPAQGRIIVLTETLKSLDSTERRRGFDEVMQQDFPHLEVMATIETYGDGHRLQRVAATLSEKSDKIAGVYVISSEAAPILTILSEAPPLAKAVTIAHEVTPTTERLLRSGQVDALIAQDPGHLVRSALRILRARSDSTPLVASQEVIRIEILLRENLARIPNLMPS